MKRPSLYYAHEVPGPVFHEFADTAKDTFGRNLSVLRSADLALGATYLDGMLAGVLMVLKYGPERFRAVIAGRPVLTHEEVSQS